MSDFLRPRPFLCPEETPGFEAVPPWTPSRDNQWWHPAPGRYPATGLLLPGDVLLFAPIKPSPSQETIRLIQSKWGAAPEHARFTHAALYVGLDHLLCESIPNRGVTYSPLWQRIGAACLLVRRWPGLTLSQRQQIARVAVRLLGRPYGWKSGLLESLKRGWGARWDQHVTRGLVCSRLCDRSLSTALLELGLPADQVALHRSPSQWTTPADLSATPRLTDVEVGWSLSEPSFSNRGSSGPPPVPAPEAAA